MLKERLILKKERDHGIMKHDWRNIMKEEIDYNILMKWSAKNKLRRPAD